MPTLDTATFGRLLKNAGFDLFTGVPCSFLTPLINYALNEAEYVNVANEGEAVAVAAGAALGGRRPVVMFQNSGLTNALSPLASLVQPYQIPLLGFVTWRGEPGLADAPQHALMGAVTTRLLDLLGLAWAVLDTDPARVEHQVAQANAHLNGGRSYFFVVREGTFSKVALRERAARPADLTRRDVLMDLVRLLPEALMVATTGYTGRELAEVRDRPENFYMTGSMGCASSFGLGLALVQPRRRVVVVDGDGAALMRLSAWPALARCAPSNLLHVVLDNGCHESTGSQATLSAGVDFVGLARAAGYPQAHRVETQSELVQHVQTWAARPAGGLTLLVVPTRPGVTSPASRPELPLSEVARRFGQAARS